MAVRAANLIDSERPLEASFQAFFKTDHWVSSPADS